MKAVKNEEIEQDFNDFLEDTGKPMETTEQEQGVKEGGVFAWNEGGLIVLEIRTPQNALGVKLTIEQAYSVAKFLQVHADEASAAVEVVEPIEMTEAE